MGAHLIALAIATFIFLVPLSSGCAAMNDINPNMDIGELDLPSALTEDDSFNDLPFEQLKQALREEVEYGPKKGINPRSLKKYNLLIR